MRKSFWFIDILRFGRVSAMLSDIKVTKTVTVRELKRGAPEEALVGARPPLRLKGLVCVRR